MKGIFRGIEITDLDYLEKNLLPINKEEIKALHGLTIKELLLQNDLFFNHTDVWEIDGEIICIFGGFPIGKEMMIWLLGTEKLKDYKQKFAIWTLRRLKKEKQNYDLFYSCVYEKNEITKEWLEKLGFNILAAEPMGINGELFHRFEMR